MAVLERLGCAVPASVASAMRKVIHAPQSPITLLADGFDAAQAVANVAEMPVRIRSEWLRDDVLHCLDDMFAVAGPGLTISVGEPVLTVSADGLGGRNTHAAVEAGRRLAGTDAIFIALATDGGDGSSGAAGAIVDGTTVSRGGDPSAPLARFDTATYLRRTGDLLKCPATGTNVADLWVLWKQT
jgi:hypothetical protein